MRRDRWAGRQLAQRPILAFWLAALAMCISAPVARAQGRPPAPTSYEEGAFEMVVPGMASVPLTLLVSPRGTYLLPLRATLEPLGIPLTLVADSGVARVSRPAGIGTATLSWAGAPVITAGTVTALDSSDVVMRAGVLYLSAPAVARLIESRVDVDLATLTVQVQRDGGFPAQMIAGVRQRRDQALRSGALAQAARPAVPFRPTTGFGVVEWALGGPMSPLSTPTSVETRAGMGLWGGLLKAGGILSLPGDGTGATGGYTEASYQRVFPDATLLRQVQVGDIVSGGALARPIRGFSLTNAPFVRSLRFGVLPFSRPLPPGWEYEVYEGDRLIGFADASTHTALNVPVQYGMTPLRVRLYGPAGETVESTVSFVIPVEQIPEGEWQYAVGGGRCAAEQCREMGYADLRHGVTRFLTVQAGVDETRDSTSRVVRPYAAVSVIPAAGWTADLQARRRAFLRASVQRFGDERVTGSASIGVNAAGEGGIAVARETDGVVYAQTSLQLLHVFAALGDRSLTLATRVERPQHGGTGRWDVTSYLPIDRGVVEAGVQSNPLAGIEPGGSSTPIVRIAPTISLSRGQLRRLGSPVLRMEGGFEGARLAQWDLGLSLQPGRGSVSLAIRHLIGTPGTQLTLGGSVLLGAARLLSRVTGRGGHLDGAYSANGAVAFGTVRRVSALDYGGLGLSGVEGRIFRDVNGDGRFGPGDEPAPGVTVSIGGLRAQADSSGGYALWSVLPYEQLDVQVDSLSLVDPSWVPALALRTVRPSPQQYTRIDFPLVHMREVIGRLEGPPGMPTGGVGIELRGVGSGALYEARTFSDGAYYLTHVRPGRYALTLTESSSRALGARLATPVTVVVPAEGDEVVEIPASALVPIAQVPATVR